MANSLKYRGGYLEKQTISTTAQNFTGSWVDYGSEIDVLGITRLGLWLNLDVNDSDRIVLSTDRLNFTVDVADTHNITNVLMNGSILTNTTGYFTTINSTGDFGCTGDRDCTLTIMAYDMLGNLNDTETITLEVDDIPPDVVNFAANDTLVRSIDSINFSAIVTDTHNITSVSLNGTIMQNYSSLY